jgi:hypothetical protein
VYDVHKKSHKIEILCTLHHTDVPFFCFLWCQAVYIIICAWTVWMGHILCAKQLLDFEQSVNKYGSLFGTKKKKKKHQLCSLLWSIHFSWSNLHIWLLWLNWAQRTEEFCVCFCFFLIFRFTSLKLQKRKNKRKISFMMMNCNIIRLFVVKTSVCISFQV